MKKFIYLLTILSAFVTSKSQATEASLFNYDAAYISASLSTLTEAENYFLQNSEMASSTIIENFGLTNHLAAPDGAKEFGNVDAVISVASGILLGCIGIGAVTLIYYLIYDDKEITKKALAFSSGGCLVFTTLYIAFLYTYGI